MLLSLQAPAERVDRSFMPYSLSFVPPLGSGDPFQGREEIPPSIRDLGPGSGRFGTGGPVRVLKIVLRPLRRKVGGRIDFYPFAGIPLFSASALWELFPGGAPGGVCPFGRCLDRYRVLGAATGVSVWVPFSSPNGLIEYHNDEPLNDKGFW